jgi:hypothetical protein
VVVVVAVVVVVVVVELGQELCSVRHAIYADTSKTPSVTHLKHPHVLHTTVVLLTTPTSADRQTNKQTQASKLAVVCARIHSQLLHVIGVDVSRHPRRAHPQFSQQCVEPK